ncbi:4482_t:CDS:10 [Paraglomus occultum]|uniref:proline--tRNA ligase n=1 Tax=Paraglomus occultum TaxID=144539 RepID=A0A9N9BD06_9GLOM|nr:4482_t:CDS:10 [Paraglomus occultum]
MSTCNTIRSSRFRSRSISRYYTHESLRCSSSTARSSPRALLSQLFLPTVKEIHEGTSKHIGQSHRLMIRAGLIRQSSSGIFSFLPFGLRSLRKVEKIIDEEMENIGAQKLSLPTLLSANSWRQTGRWETAGSELFRLKDRKQSEFCLAPTHEEEITLLVAEEISSYRQLPLRLYQIDRKYRDEMRPRSGLLRGREFMMKDLYTFDKTEEASVNTYKEVVDAYKRIFSRIGLPYVVLIASRIENKTRTTMATYEKAEKALKKAEQEYEEGLNIALRNPVLKMVIHSAPLYWKLPVARPIDIMDNVTSRDLLYYNETDCDSMLATKFSAALSENIGKNFWTPTQNRI